MALPPGARTLVRPDGWGVKEMNLRRGDGNMTAGHAGRTEVRAPTRDFDSIHRGRAIRESPKLDHLNAGSLPRVVDPACHRFSIMRVFG